MTAFDYQNKADRRNAMLVASPEVEWLKASQKGIGDRVPFLDSAPAKRAFDVVFAILLLIPLSFVMAIVAIMILVMQGRPIFYTADRMRSPGLSFRQLKFRTMLQQENDSGASGAHKNWRITPIGRFLRRTRLDELPQLFNILVGDMSFVGPRPALLEYGERFPDHYAQILQNRPGVTGLATLIYHRHEDRILASCKTAAETEMAYYRRCLPAKLKIEEIYWRHRDMRLDLWILWNTLKITLLHRTARPRRNKSNKLRVDRVANSGQV